MIGKLVKSKIISHKVHNGTIGKLHVSGFGGNTNTFNVPFKSGTKAASDPTC